MSYLCVWDFTISKKFLGQGEIVKILEEACKKWSFQEESGESGYEHYQGRVSFKTKKRLTGCKKVLPEAHWSITSNENKKNCFYVLKEETRTLGPWTNEDVKVYIPRQIREIDELYPWQQKIIDISKIWDKRTINIIYDEDGNIGKSILITYMGVYGLGRRIPCNNNYKDIMRMVMDMPTDKVYLIDMPRAINKENLAQLYSALETIKSGYAWDDRYAFKEKYFDCPNIFVFTNKIPDQSLLTGDRWKLWRINHQSKELEVVICGAAL